ncbi:MAG: DEAD/DEAH box helicase [Methanoregula sp.]|jgi:DNA modification methylase|nr:DEAD/DEAH box helicase [Methanoregula sp.]
MIEENISAYEQFIASKRLFHESCGITIDKNILNPLLFDFQKDIVVWALQKGKACIFLGTGLGKTFIQLSWANEIYKQTKHNVLIVAPLAVANQTVKEGQKIGISITLCRTQKDVMPGINITNYDMLHAFEASQFIAVVLDESSILKSFNGQVRTQIIEMFRETPYKLACTATPAPNDYMELGNHSEFVGVMGRTEMLSMFFVHDGGETSKWRLKGHSIKKFWEWVATWAVMMSKPSDLGYQEEQFNLPPLSISQVSVSQNNGFVVRSTTLSDRRKARMDSLPDRVKKCAEIVNASKDIWIVWCDLNSESEQLHKAIPGSVEVRGSHYREFKEEKAVDFTDGNIRVLISKPQIFGYGMNWQVCSNVAFVGLSDSFEQYYQAVRRCWRFGQDKPVNVNIITSSAEGPVVANIKRKENDFNKMIEEMIAATQEITSKNIRQTERKVEEYMTESQFDEKFTLIWGDSCEKIKDLEDESVHFIIYSPPFSQLYCYSNSERDLGNSKNDNEFFQHFQYLASEMFRILKPGREMSFHCMDIPRMKERDGVIGMKDFSGQLIKLFEDIGFIYHSRVTIWKCPVIEMTRTKALGLLHKQIKKDSSMSRNGLPDYVITMRKPGDNPEPITHDDRSYPVEKWQKIASPVWMDIKQGNTLQRESAREDEDEKHICPLQLDVIERCIELWTNPGDLIFDPFAGIGSTIYQAVKMGRKGYGIELKKAYYDQAVENLKIASLDANTKQISLEAFIFQEKLIV